MRRTWLALAGGLTVLAGARASAQQLGDRPSEQDLFGGGATPPASAPATPPAAAPPATTTAAPPAPPASPNAQPNQPAAAAAQGTSRDQELLGNGEEAKFLADYVAPENPLQIGGQLYLRAQSTASAGQAPADWSLSAPSLLDVYLDARPNPRVRGFILGRMAFDPTLPVSSNSSMGSAQAGSNGALAGGTPTGFSTFSNTRGPSTLLDQMWIRFDILQKVFVTAGKQHVRFGTGRFWQPTDYLHPVKRNPLDVFDARPGETMLKLNIPWEEQGWNFYAFGIAEDPNVETNTVGKVAGAARVEAVVAGVELGADIYLHRGDRPRYGFDFSTGIWDFDVYGDMALRPGGDFFHYDPALDTVGVYTGYETQIVGGLNYSRKYNDNDMWTAGVEYFYNHPGYSSASAYQPALKFALDPANAALIPNGNPFSLFPFFYLGRQYGAVFASFPAPYSWNYTTFTFSTLGNLSDKSFISRIDYSVTVLTHLSVEAFVGVHYGHVGGEFRFELPSSVASQIGALSGATVLSTYPIVDLGAALRIKI